MCTASMWPLSAAAIKAVQNYLKWLDIMMFLKKQKEVYVHTYIPIILVVDIVPCNSF